MVLPISDLILTSAVALFCPEVGVLPKLRPIHIINVEFHEAHAFDTYRLVVSSVLNYDGEKGKPFGGCKISA